MPQPKVAVYSHLRHVALFALCCLCTFTTEPIAKAQEATPRVRSVSVQKISLSESDRSKATLILVVSGEKFGNSSRPTTVRLINQATGVTLPARVTSHTDSKIVASADVDVSTQAVTYVPQLTLAGADVIRPEHLSDYTIEIKQEEKPPQTAEPFEITYETFKNEQYPNLYSLLITNKNAKNKPGFSPNPSLMKVDVIPAGVTNLAIQPGSSPHQMVVTFLAPDGFETKGVIVTVFDPDSTLGATEPVAFSTPFQQKQPKTDPNQHKIADIKILAIQRRLGIGRVLIQGSGFGDYERPPISGERELLCCVERSMKAFERHNADNKDFRGVALRESGPDAEVCNIALPAQCEAMQTWRRRIEERVNVALVPRNPNLRVERTQIMYIDDKIIDVYFEFTHFPGYSQPFRLASASVSINKGSVRVTQEQTADTTVTATVSGPQTYADSRDIGVPSDKNLEYRYTVLDQKDASLLFGSGVADNFFAIELAVLNRAENKVVVPLSAIQAEIEWAYGKDPRGDEFYYEDGDATIPPLALSEITSYFDTYHKTKGRRAKLFNVLSGVATLGAALVPVFGQNIERPVAILTGGLTPALRTVFGDLSSEQLQNLTARTWENVEEVPAKSGKTKFIFIQRGDQLFDGDVPPKVKKQIKNIRGLEVIGFEVLESKEKLASQQQQ